MEDLAAELMGEFIKDCMEFPPLHKPEYSMTVLELDPMKFTLLPKVVPFRVQVQHGKNHWLVLECEATLLSYDETGTKWSPEVLSERWEDD